MALQTTKTATFAAVSLLDSAHPSLHASGMPIQLQQRSTGLQLSYSVSSTGLLLGCGALHKQEIQVSNQGQQSGLLWWKGPES